MQLDEKTKEQILAALAAHDEKVVDEMAARLRQIIAIILASGSTSHIAWVVPNTAANQLAAERVNRDFPDVFVGIRVA